MKLFSVYDRKSEGWKPPFAIPTVGEAERAFRDACRDVSTDLGKHPEDYALYCVGDFDQLSGETMPALFHVCNGTVLGAEAMKVVNDG